MTAERIANLTKRINDLETALQASESRYKALHGDLLAPMQNNRLKALAAAYGTYSDTRTPRLMMLMSVLQLAVDAQDPLRGAPNTDTMRIGHPEHTATEASVLSYQRERANVRWIGEELEHFIDRIQRRVQPGDEPAGDKPVKPRCWSSHCQGKRSPIGARFCINCGKSLSKEEAA